MTSKSEAYRKDLGNPKFLENYDQIMWNSQKSADQPKSDAQNGAKFDDTELGAYGTMWVNQ